MATYLTALIAHYVRRVALLYRNLSNCFDSTLHPKERSFVSELFLSQLLSRVEAFSAAGFFNGIKIEKENSSKKYFSIPPPSQRTRPPPWSRPSASCATDATINILLLTVVLITNSYFPPLPKKNFIIAKSSRKKRLKNELFYFPRGHGPLRDRGAVHPVWRQPGASQQRHAFLHHRLATG